MNDKDEDAGDGREQVHDKLYTKQKLENVELKKQLAKETDELQQARAKLQKSRERAEAMRESRDSFQKKAKDANAKKAKKAVILAQKVEKLKGVNAVQKSKIAAQEKQLTHLKDLKNKVASLEDKIKNLQDAAADDAKRKKELEVEKKRLRTTMTELRKDLTELEKKDKQNSHYKKRSEDLQKRVTDLQRRSKKLEQEADPLRDRVSTHKKRRQELEVERDQLNEAVDKPSSTSAQDKAEDEDSNETEEERKEETEKIEDQLQKIRQQQKELEAKEAALEKRDDHLDQRENDLKRLKKDTISDRGPHTTPRHDRYTRNCSPHTANSPTTGSSSTFGRDHSYNAEKRGGYKSSFPNRFGSDDTNYQTGFQNVVSYGDTQFSDSLFHQEDRTNYKAKMQAPPEFGIEQKDVDTNNRYKRQDELWSGKTSPNSSASASGKWKSRRVEEQKRQQEKKKKDRSWWYLDPQQETQGPFNEEEMKDWFNEGFFGVDLPVRCHPESLFVPLGDWFRQGNTAFLEEIPEEHRSKTGEDTSNATTQPSPHSPRKTASTPVSVLNNQANSNLAMSSLSGVIDDSSKPHVQPQDKFVLPSTVSYSSRQVTRHTQFPPPTGSTLNMNAPAFNPMGGTDRYKPPPAAPNLNAKSTLPPQSNDQNLFSHYRNQERTKPEPTKPAKGSSYSTQHDLRQNTTSSSSTFDTGHNPLQTSAHPRPPMVSGVGNMRFGTTQPNGFIPDGALGGISTTPPVTRNAFGYGGTTSGSDISRTNSKLVPPNDEKGGWKEIGTISSPHSRQDSNLSSPFGSGTIGSDPYAHIPLKHAAEPKGNVSPWTRPAIMTPEVKKTQSEINEQPENDSLRRTNEHAQIQRQRSPQESSRNFNWGGLNGTANNHNQRQQQQNRVKDKRISSNAQKPPLVNKLKGANEGAKPRQASSTWASASNSSWDTRPPRIPQVRNPQAPSNPSSRGSPGGSNRQWNTAASKLDDQMSGSHSSKSTSANSSVLTQSIGSKNSSVNRTASTRKPLIKGDPTMASSKRTNASSKGKNKNTETNSFGVKISPDFEEWCLKHINECAAQTGEDLDARALIHFLMTLSRKDEIREYIVNYLGDSPKVQEFADGFIQLKNFETTAGESTFQESKRSRRKRRRNKKRE